MVPGRASRRHETVGVVDPDTRKAAKVDTELERFRQRVRLFLELHATGGADVAPNDPRGDRALDEALRFQRALFAAGLAGLSLPASYGGQGLPDAYETVWREEAGRFPLMTEELSVTLGNCLPTLLEFGTEPQRRRHAARIVAGHEVWCQLFSEPGAGSDVAGVQTRAVAVEGGWLVNGQKVWTTLAHRGDFGILLARTDPNVAKHAGLSMFILDLHSPGVDTRPIRQLDGGAHFDEVFLTDVFVPNDALLPPAGAGWRIASAMLHHQRVARAQGQRGGLRHDRTDRLIAEARRRGALDPDVRDALARLYIAEVCQSLLVGRATAATAKGTDPGPVGSLGKLTNALVGQQFGQLAWRIVGLDALAWTGPALGAASEPSALGAHRTGAESAGDAAGAQWAKDALFTLSLSIAGGTNEIQRSILAERVLGLPRESSAPWPPTTADVGPTGAYSAAAEQRSRHGEERLLRLSP
jgi:alkylation response protein AidB-like acyl-CoA dehydrogenase